MKQEFQDALDHSIEITLRNLETLTDFPERCEGETWTTIDRNRIPAHWNDGFWVGLLWLAFAHTGDPKFERGAREWAKQLAWLKDETRTHDLGFIFWLANVLGARVTGDESLLPDALQAARTLTRRYNARGEYLQAWGLIDGTREERGRTNIDLMMNLSLLFWASERTGDPYCARVAARHARTSRLVLVRPDDSTVHVGDFDPETGAFLRHATHQGLSADSCWSRGQGWALYGFADTYRRTGDEVFRAVAQRLAEYALIHAPEDLVPFWDYDSPDTQSANTYRDSSAAAVMASGLLDLAEIETDAARAARWRAFAEKIALSLWQNYSSRGTRIPAILLHGTRSVPHGLADHALIYGDYYFVETLTKLLRPDIAAHTK
ncbi:MAG: glucuronyl hydrolase [Chloroflexi bacterium]|nr:glucuronyl hydrolase [Chloroflexota bacterium]